MINRQKDIGRECGGSSQQWRFLNSPKQTCCLCFTTIRCFSYYYFFHSSLLRPCSLYLTLHELSTFFVFRMTSRFHYSDSLNFHSPFTSFHIKHQNVRYSLPHWPVTVPFAFVLSALSIYGRSLLLCIPCYFVHAIFISPHIRFYCLLFVHYIHKTTYHTIYISVWYVYWYTLYVYTGFAYLTTHLRIEKLHLEVQTFVQ